MIGYAKWSTQEVVELLQGLLDGSYDDNQWDSFVSMKIEDAALEHVRKQVVGAWVQDSPYMQPGEVSPAKMNSEGRALLERFVLQCRDYENYQVST